MKVLVIEDAKKITAEQKVSYAFDMKSPKEKWKLVLDQRGNVLSKVRD